MSVSLDRMNVGCLRPVFSADREMILDLHSDESEDSADEDVADGSQLHIGQLVWGKMHGFPYWPCFITQSPDGTYSRQKSVDRKCIQQHHQYHVQFFNWNDESGWISKYRPWSTRDELRAVLANQKALSDLPSTKIMKAKWSHAVELANMTKSWTNKQRYQRLVVLYASSTPPRSETDDCRVESTDVGAFFKSRQTTRRKSLNHANHHDEIRMMAMLHQSETELGQDSGIGSRDRSVGQIQSGDCDVVNVRADCRVEVVRLPDLFLQHPTVRVAEEGTQLLVWDALTGHFLAKKIVYNR